MTDRMALYLDFLKISDDITGSVFLTVVGVMGLWYVWRMSPIPFLRKLSCVPFWTFILVADLGLMAAAILVK